MIELFFVALLLGVAVPLILWREPIGRYLHTFGLGFVIWWGESDMRAFMARESEANEKERLANARAALKAAGEPTPEHQGRAHADLRV